jgi:hypothetical protein
VLKLLVIRQKKLVGHRRKPEMFHHHSTSQQCQQANEGNGFGSGQVGFHLFTGFGF